MDFPDSDKLLESTMVTVGKNLVKFRLHKNLSRRKLAFFSNISIVSVLRIENSRDRIFIQNPRLSTLLAICFILKINIAELFKMVETEE